MCQERNIVVLEVVRVQGQESCQPPTLVLILQRNNETRKHNAFPMALQEVVSEKQGKKKCGACKRTPNDEKCGTRNLHAHTLGAAPTSAARITPLHEDANDASFA